MTQNVNLSALADKRMTSLEIAEVTGKQHAHVMRDIKALLEQGVHKSNFGLMFRIIKLGNNAERKDPYYELTPKGVLILASGYNVLLREKIINRLEELEQKKNVNLLNVSNDLSDNMCFAEWSARFLNLNEASKLGWARKIGDKFGLVTDALPMAVNAGTANPTTHAATDLLKRHGVELSAVAFNKVLEIKGVVKQCERPGRGGTTHRWMVLLPAFDRYGQNQQDPRYQQQTQIRWYDATFNELLTIVGLNKQQMLNL